MNAIDPMGLKTTYQLNVVGGARLIVGGSIGKATGKTDCVNGKRYEADYMVVSAGFTGGAELESSQLFNTISKNFTSTLFGKTFTRPENYPESYISYLDIEGFAASLGYGCTFGDAEVGVYEGGRGDVKLGSCAYTGEVGLQIFKFTGVHLIRLGKVREFCCDN